MNFKEWLEEKEKQPPGVIQTSNPDVFMVKTGDKIQFAPKLYKVFAIPTRKIET